MYQAMFGAFDLDATQYRQSCCKLLPFPQPSAGPEDASQLNSFPDSSDASKAKEEIVHSLILWSLFLCLASLHRMVDRQYLVKVSLKP